MKLLPLFSYQMKAFIFDSNLKCFSWLTDVLLTDIKLDRFQMFQKEENQVCVSHESLK